MTRRFIWFPILTCLSALLLGGCSTFDEPIGLDSVKVLPKGAYPELLNSSWGRGTASNGEFRLLRVTIFSRMDVVEVSRTKGININAVAKWCSSDKSFYVSPWLGIAGEAVIDFDLMYRDSLTKSRDKNGYIRYEIFVPFEVGGDRRYAGIPDKEILSLKAIEGSVCLSLKGGKMWVGEVGQTNVIEITKDRLIEMRTR